MNHIKKECVAMLLAGGQGSRLYALTQEMAKPAVPYGGKYRIIDFPLSNCVNSGIDTVGVLTQYQPLVLNEYIGNGQPWGLDRAHGGVHVLPPYETAAGKAWYSGTANAIYQNIGFIDRYDPEYVVILSGDHIYKMDYSKMVDFHKQHEADATIAVLEVPWEEAPRFGIMSANPDGTIYEFAEKPKEPKSNLASMGIYVFTWSKLRKYLIDNENDEGATKDFGKNIIPAMLENKEKMVAYHFDGYWKDVGTIDSLWEANMDVLDPKVPLDLLDDNWKIYSRNPVMPPHYAGPSSQIQNSMVAEGCEIYGMVNHSIISTGCSIGKGAEVTDSVIMPDVVIENGAVVRNAIIAEGCHVKAGARIGEFAADGERRISVVGKDKQIAEGAVIAAGAIV